MTTKSITAKHSMQRHIRVNGKLELREWISGKAYEATFQHGEIIVHSEQTPVSFNGIQQEEVSKNFIFWGEENG